MAGSNDFDGAKLLYGQNAVHVPAWLYVQDAGQGTVSFVGASRVPEDQNPLRYGSDRTHQFVLGEIIVRPHLVIATDTLRGLGLPGLATNHHDIQRMLADGEALVNVLNYDLEKPLW